MAMYPTIIIPGIGQSRVKTVDAAGNVNGSIWPIDIDFKGILDDVKKSLMKMMIFRKDNGFSDKCADIVRKTLAPAAVSREGRPINQVQASPFGALSAMTDGEKRFVYKMVPMEELGEVLGEDKLYYFAYNPFGNVFDTAEDLSALIEQALADTGAEKVNLIAVSLGGCVLRAYLMRHAAEKRVAKIVNVVAALDGTSIAGDVFEGKLYTDDPAELVRKLGIGGAKVEAALPLVKTIPEPVLRAVIDKCFAALLDALGASTMLWASVPCARLDDALAKQASRVGAIEADVRALGAYTEGFADTAKALADEGVEFYQLCGYNRQLLQAVHSYMTSSDCVIDTVSASMGATCAAPDEKLDAQGELVSPDGNCDASTCAFPDRTWFFYDLRHDDIAWNDVALSLVRNIIVEGDISFETFPRFNGTRNIRALKYDLIKKAKALIETNEKPEKTELLRECVAEYDELLRQTRIEGQEAVRALERKIREALE